jgi:hypothetical protein
MSYNEVNRSKELLETEIRTGLAGQVIWWVGAGCVFAGKIWKKIETGSFRDASGLAHGSYKVTKQMQVDHVAARELYSLLILIGVILTIVGCVLLFVSYILKRKRIAACKMQAGKDIEAKKAAK